MVETADIVIAGAGHNSLITAAYLSRAGYSCIIVDGREIPGGGAATEELLMPGLGIDSCSTGHTLIRVNPLIKDDELGLVSKYGLDYIDPDPVGHVTMPDGDYLTMWLDKDRTVEEFARHSPADARAYARMYDDYDAVKDLFGQGRFRPLGHGPSAGELLKGHAREATWRRRMVMSAWDVITREFENRHVRSFMLWMTFQTLVALDRPGTGTLAYSLIHGRQRNSWSIPKGGSGRLVDALVGFLEDHGASIHCGKTVTELILENGRCVGFETEDGSQFRARQAVLSTIHIKHLVEMAPADAWGEDFLYGADTYDVGISGYAAYLATKVAPVFTTEDGGRNAVSSGIAGWPEQMLRAIRDMSDGVFFEDVPFLLVATPTLVDQSRSVDGLHTVKLLSAQTYELPDGKDWATEKEVIADRFLRITQRFAPNFTDDQIVGRIVKSPDDIEAMNPHMIRGAFHGGDRSIANAALNRPVPGWAQHRMPIAGLYQTGGTTHPGGSITGAPGRNAAMIMLEDFGRDPSEVMAV